MPKNEDGEFELILGNRQLLSVFFIVVVLLGVFFTMGYIVGRNSGPIAPAEVAASHKESKPMVVDSAAPSQPPPESKSPAAPAETKPQQADPPKQESVKSEPPKPEPVKETRLKADAAKPEPRKNQEPAPAAGQVYLQLTATTQHEAEVYADVLKKKGFHAITSIVPDKPGLVRVMVGPMPESSVGKTRADLTAAGFPGDKAIKRAL